MPRSNGILLRALQGGVGPWDHKVGLIIATGFDRLWPPLSSTSVVSGYIVGPNLKLHIFVVHQYAYLFFS